MKDPRFARALIIGLVIGAIGFGGWRSVSGGAVPADPAPMDEILRTAELEESAEVSWDLPTTPHERVEFWTDFLTGRNYDKTRLWLERSGRYAPMIRAELRARGMPEDLIWFAMIESGFSNRAYSRAHAVGMWQFIEETGVRYGLEVNSYVDERRDPLEATRAALDYLTYMHEDFGSWYLAAAGYNSGENRIRRILREKLGGARGSEDLYWSIREYLPAETRDYVPLMMAAGHIGKEPEKYGFLGLELQAPLAFDTVEVPGGTNLDVVARAAGTPLEEIQELNAHLVRGMTPPNRVYPVRIPAGRSEIFAANFGTVAEQMAVATRDHTVRPGETLGHIARRYGISVSALEAANRGLNPRRLQVGQKVLVPGSGGIATAQPEQRADGGWTTYRVRNGDTLWEIARRNDVSVRELQGWNRLGRSSRIRPGQQLRIRA